MSSPTPASRNKIIQAPAWAVRLLTPLVSRLVAREMAKKYPGLSPAEVGEKMRADMPSGSDPAAFRMVDAVVARLPSDGKLSAEEAKPESSASTWFLLATNLLPLYGVFVWGWDVFALLALFWMENVVVGVLNVARMLLVDPADTLLWAGKLFTVPFFCLHYGMFTAVHGLFVFGLFSGRRYEMHGLWEPQTVLRAAHELNLWLPLAALAASHLFSFLWNYLYRGEFRRASLAELMGRPYKRVIALHIAIILGGIGVAALGSPLWALVLLVAIKIGIDLAAHRKEHQQSK